MLAFIALHHVITASIRPAGILYLESRAPGTSSLLFHSSAGIRTR
jgi:hypothetical protein